jgi:hypothetical protein
MAAPGEVVTQQSPQALQCAKLATLEGPFTDAEDRGGVGGRQLLQVPQDKHLAIAGRELGESRLDPAANLRANEMLAGADARLDQPAGQLGGGFIRQLQNVGLLARDGALAGFHVAPVQIDDAVPGKLTEPGVKRQRPTSQVIGKLPGSIGEGLLNHVRRVDARPKPAVEVDRDHFPQARPMPAQQLLASGLVPVGSPVEQLVGARITPRHRVYPLRLTPQKTRKGFSFILI